MANLVQELLIKVGIKSDIAQGKDVAATVERIGGAVKATAPEMQKAGTASRDLASALGKNVEVGGASINMMTQLGQAGQGGAAGMVAAARAGMAFSQMIKGVLAGAGPIGIAVTAITVLGAAAYGLVKAFAAPKQSIDDLKAKLAELDAANLKQIDATISSLTDRLKAAKGEADAVRAAMDTVDDAEMGLELKANAKSGGTEADKARNEYVIRDKFKKAKEVRAADAATQSAKDAAEVRDALAPEYGDARDKYASALSESDRIKSEDRELERLKDQRARRMQGEGGYMLTDAQHEQGKIEQARIDELERGRPSKGTRGNAEAELASAKNAFEGKDGSGGISAKYNAAAQAADKADAALKRLLDTRQKLDTIEKGSARLDFGDVPTEAEAQKRKSPGRARMVGPDGTVKEYDVASAPTNLQGVESLADNAKRGPIAAPVGAVQRGGGPLPGDGVAGKGITDASNLKPAADKITAAMGDATKSTEVASEGMDAAAKATKDFADAQSAANEQLSTTFAAQADTMSTLTGGVSDLSDAITRAFERIKRLEAQAKEASAKARAAAVK